MESKGCLASFWGGCLAVILGLGVLAAVAGYFLLGKLDVFFEKMKPVIADVKRTVEEGKKQLVEKGVELSVGSFQAHLRELKYSDEEQSKIMEPVRGLAERVKRGEIGVEKGLLVLQGLLGGRIGAALQSREWEVRYLPSSSLDATALESAKRDINRYHFARLDKKIPQEFVSSVESIVYSETVNERNEPKRELKKSLTTTEFEVLMQSVRRALEKANISPDPVRVDIAAELRAFLAKELP